MDFFGFLVSIRDMSKSLEKEARRLLSLADVEVNGNRPWDIQVHDERFYSRVLRGGSLALGESYMDGWWDVPKLDQFFERVLGAGLRYKVRFGFRHIMIFIASIFFNRQSKGRSFEVAYKHYDIGNDLYRATLGGDMIYTCAYWKEAKDLDKAQEDKLDLVCRKLNLKPGQHILDIGCGWGGFAKFASQKYGARVTGVTISKEQAELARKFCEGLPVEIQLKDYRDIEGGV